MRELDRKNAQYEGVSDKLTIAERSEFESYVQSVVARRSEVRQKKLSSQLSPIAPSTKFPSQPERYVHNFSSLQLDKTLLEVLSLGPKFCIPRRKISQLELEVQFENLYDQLSELTPSSERNLEQMKSTLVNCCYQYLNHKPSVKQLLKKEHFDALKRLHNDDQILVSKPDKGAGIVLMNRADYNHKMNTILSDQTKFIKMQKERDKTAVIEKAISKVLRSMKQAGYIDAVTFARLHPTGSVIPRMYGLPKVHKPGLPLRPILDMSNSPYHPMAKWLAEILEPIRRELAVHSVTDTFQFVNKINDLRINDHYMFSLDVESLFTNVPLKETVNYICDYIENSDRSIGLPVVQLKKLILMCTENVQFRFNNEIYRQKDGVAMGSPLGPLLADVFISKLETKVLHPLIEKFSLYCRYMDDIFVIASVNISPDEVLNQFNAAHTSVNLTSELETDGKLNFLDVNVVKTPDGTLKREVYRKRMWTGIYIHFDRFTPPRQTEKKSS